MAKTNGLGVRIYANGYDLNTDVNALSGIGTNQALLETTSLSKTATERIIGLQDSTLSVNGWFDNAAGMAHDAFKSIAGDSEVIMTMGTSRGDAACGMVADQSSYNIDRSQGSAIATTVEFSTSDGNGLNWGVVLTDGPEQTDSSAANSASVDNAASTSNGARAVISVESIASGSAVIKIQESADNAAWADMMTFSTVSARTSEATSMTGTVPRYLRVQTSGTFTNLVFVVQIARL
tara:strand:- start:1896 stop:2603 length:708 start_codon:yes stop_codon:yes gene_type:complete